MRLLVLALMIIGLLAGFCPLSSPPATGVDAPDLTTLATAELANLINSVEHPVIFDSGELHGCGPFARIRPQIHHTASASATEPNPMSADFTANQRLRQSFGATIGTPYILFLLGGPSQIHTSPEMLVSTGYQATCAAAPSLVKWETA